MRSRKVFIVTVGVLIIAGVWFFFGRGISHDQTQTRQQKVTVAQFGDLLMYLPLYIAVDEGIFAKHGLAVDIVSTGGDDKTFAAVLSGDAQFGLADPTFVAIAHERGQLGRVIALLIDGVPNYGVALSLSAPTISKPADLAGKTVATVPAPSTSYVLVRKLFDEARISPAIYQVAPSGLVSALQAHQADYALLIEPWVSGVLRQGGKIGFSLMDYYDHFALTGLTTSQQTINNNRETVSKFVAALTESVSVFYDNREATIRVAKKRFPNEKIEDLQAGINRHRIEEIYPRNLIVKEASWTPAVKLRLEMGDLKKPARPMGEYVDNSFAENSAAQHQ